jgi:uncharacterized repeat protein (TIGR03943 family)
VNARTQAYLLLLFGGALIRLAAGDALLRYVRPVARPWVLLAGAGLVVIATAQLIQQRRTDRRAPGSVRTGWLLLAPVVAIVVIAPPALGTFSAAHAASGMVDASTQKQFPPLTGPSPHSLGLLDFTTRVLWDSGRTVAGQDVQLTGFVLSERSDGFVLARLVITCCAADARPVEIFVTSHVRPPKGQWVNLIGRYQGTDPDQPLFPRVAATDVQPTAQPANPYD